MAETKSASPGIVVRFGVFQANLAARELRKHGVRIRLPGQPFCILSLLLERPGEIVTREEMRQKLWASDTFVDFEHSLNSAIKKLRAALGDTPENSRYIETVPRVGYRFIAPVEQVSATAPLPPVEDSVTTGRSGVSATADEPGERRWQVLLGALLYFSRQYDSAIEQFRAVLQRDPNFVRSMLVIYAYVEKGMFAQALAKTEGIGHVFGKGPWYWSEVAYIYGREGRLEQARHELEKLEKLNRRQQVDPVTMLWAHLGMGDKEEALADLERAYSGHFGIMTTLKVEPGFEPLRSDPRFQDLLRRVGLGDTGANGVSTAKP